MFLTALRYMFLTVGFVGLAMGLAMVFMVSLVLAFEAISAVVWRRRERCNPFVDRGESCSRREMSNYPEYYGEGTND